MYDSLPLNRVELQSFMIPTPPQGDRPPLGASRKKTVIRHTLIVDTVFTLITLPLLPLSLRVLSILHMIGKIGVGFSMLHILRKKETTGSLQLTPTLNLLLFI